MYIYCITNLINNKKYIGQTTQKPPQKRWNNHKCSANNNTCCVVHDAIKKYGIDNFTFDIIDECTSIIDLNKAEIKWINYYDTFLGEGYNMNEGGSNYIMSEEHKQKIGTANKGKIRTEETLKKMSDSHKGHIMSEETRNKISKGNKGKIRTEEMKIKMRERSTGKSHSEETLKKMSEKAKDPKHYEKLLIWHGINAHPRNREIIKINKKTNQLIEKFKSIAEAAKISGINPSSISRCANGYSKSAGGFIWCFI